MKFIKRKFIRDTEFMKVETIDRNFYKGFSLCFDESETKLLQIIENRWFDFKSVAYCTVEITEKEFNEMLDKSIAYLKNSKNNPK